MFSALLNAQNKVSSIPITAVTWSIASNTNSTYTGSAQSVTVVSVTPEAIYSTSTTSATNAGGVASTTITGTGIYTGSFTSPNLTIIAATITGTAASPSTTYNAGSQSGTVITGVSPVGASYSGSLTVSGTNAGSYTTSITGKPPNYTGTVNGGTFTIFQKQLTLTGTSSIIFCGAFSVETLSITGCGGLVGADTGSLYAYNGNSIGPLTLCPVSTNDSSTISAVAQGGTNPKTGLSNGTNTIIMCAPGDYYWFVFGGSSNYLSSSAGASNYFSCGT
jgi:hypothetical protein